MTGKSVPGFPAVQVLMMLAFVAAPLAGLAQDTTGKDSTAAMTSSSSTRGVLGGEDIDGASAGSAAADPAPEPQYGGGRGGNRGGYTGYHDSGFSRFAIEGGGGFTAPVGNDVNGGFTNPVNYLGIPGNYGTDTWGGNVLVGAGYNFTKRFTLFGEYQFNTNKIPGSTLTAEYNASAVNFESNDISSIGGNVHTNSLTAEPMYAYFMNDKSKFVGYVMGGFGYYRKTINFTAPVLEEGYFGQVYSANETFSTYSDNSFGFNLGTGVAFKVFGPDSRARLFAETRYIFAATPRQSQADNANTNNFILHTGTEELFPVTFGIRF